MDSITKIGFWGYPNPAIVENIKKDYPDAEWIDLDIDFYYPKTNILPDSYCKIISMLESKISLTAAAHLAAAKRIITRVDLDEAILLAEDPVSGGFHKEVPWFYLDESPGLGITDVIGMKDI